MAAVVARPRGSVNRVTPVDTQGEQVSLSPPREKTPTGQRAVGVTSGCKSDHDQKTKGVVAGPREPMDRTR